MRAVGRESWAQCAVKIPCFNADQRVSTCVFNHGFMYSEFGAHIGKHSKGWRRLLGPSAAVAEAPFEAPAARARVGAAAASFADVRVFTVALASALTLLVLLLRRTWKRAAPSVPPCTR